jgi:hypothetical protein
MRLLKGTGMLVKRARMERLCDGDNRSLDFDGLGTVGFDRYGMTLPGLSMMSKATSAHRQRLRSGL